ncbi:hypothetical protein Taro_046463 [Colocasia esculenta]|uniref:Pentatricopeptide repeat-containing protein n=1 Tax=Colocasia esculenta TaxID=4460 RepID=A0A843WQ08_COLES|nr:hypothetical protein [Colocasia esculenta]
MSLIRFPSAAASFPAVRDPSVGSLLESCKTLVALHQIHTRIIRKGLEQDPFVVSRFLCLCGTLCPSSPRYDREVFDRVIDPNLCLWNTVVKAHAERSTLPEALSFFRLMRRRAEVRPDGFTFPPLLKSCANAGALREGASIHGAIFRFGLEADVFVGTALIDLYGKCREIASAGKVFFAMGNPNVVSWTALIVGLLTCADLKSARNLFDKMPAKNITTWNAMIDGYVKSGDLQSARGLFDEMPEKNVVSFTSLINGYAKAGDMASAKCLFEQMDEEDIFSWSAMISGYAQNGQPNEAIKLFFDMYNHGVRPDKFVLVGLLSACSQLGCLELAKWADTYVTQSQIDFKQVHVMAALIDMNAKCGNMERARILFEALPDRNLMTYCSMMQGYSFQGLGAKAIELFPRLLHEGLTPDDVTFTVALAACNYAGLVSEGKKYFELMENDYQIVPSSDQYACMVDLLARAGHLTEAYDLIKSMKVEPHGAVWGAVLRACCIYGNVELGEVVAKKLFDIEPTNAGNYVLLSNIYAAANRWEDVSEVRNMMKERFQLMEKISHVTCRFAQGTYVNIAADLYNVTCHQQFIHLSAGLVLFSLSNAYMSTAMLHHITHEQQGSRRWPQPLSTGGDGDQPQRLLAAG